MKAAIIRDYDTEIEIADIDPRELKDDSVLIAVHAASLRRPGRRLWGGCRD